jgi:hypothetical protein
MTKTVTKTAKATSVGIIELLSGVELIRNERQRQLLIEHWTPEHDDTHRSGALAKTAAQLAVDGTDAQVVDSLDEPDAWGLVKKHRGDRIKQLMIAGALIAAEIDRVKRLKQAR